MRRAAVVALLLAVSLSCSDPVRHSSVLAGGVRVSATLRSPTVLQVRFAPPKGFHIYSLRMPAGGVQGIGIPTRVVVGGGLTKSGPATTDVPTRPLRIAVLGVVLPVYPDGPVVIRVPVARTRHGEPRVVVSYGACSADRCLAPVKRLSVPID